MFIYLFLFIDKISTFLLSTIHPVGQMTLLQGESTKSRGESPTETLKSRIFTRKYGFTTLKKRTPEGVRFSYNYTYFKY